MPEYDNVCLIIGTDYRTRFIAECALRPMNSDVLTEELVLWSKKSGNPEDLLTFEGLEFVNQAVEETCVDRGIKMHIAAVEHH